MYSMATVEVSLAKTHVTIFSKLDATQINDKGNRRMIAVGSRSLTEKETNMQ